MENIIIISLFLFFSIVLFKVTLKEYKNNNDADLKYIHLVGLMCAICMVILSSIGLIDKVVEFFI